MRAPFVALTAFAALAAPAAAAPGPVQDFRLPQPEPPAPADWQGPLPEGARGPRAAPSPTPAPAPPDAPAPAVEAPIAAPAAERLPSAPAAEVPQPPPAPAPGAQPRPTASVSPVEAPPGEPLPTVGGATPLPSPSAASSTQATTPAPAAASGGEAGLHWLWLLGGALAAVGAAFAWRMSRRRTRGAASGAPELVRPHVPAAPQPPAEPAEPAAAPSTEPLQLALEPLRLSLTLMNATLSYRLEVANRGSVPLADLQITADMISAHASLPREEQLSGPGQGTASLHRLPRLEPGESRVLEGEFRLPFPQIVPIRQGNAALLLPLARFRAIAEGSRPVFRTFAVGQPGSSGLQPFRLDQGPRVYPRLAQRAFA